MTTQQGGLVTDEELQPYVDVLPRPLQGRDARERALVLAELRRFAEEGYSAGQVCCRRGVADVDGVRCRRCLGRSGRARAELHRALDLLVALDDRLPPELPTAPAAGPVR